MKKVYIIGHIGLPVINDVLSQTDFFGSTIEGVELIQVYSVDDIPIDDRSAIIENRFVESFKIEAHQSHDAIPYIDYQHIKERKHQKEQWKHQNKHFNKRK